MLGPSRVVVVPEITPVGFEDYLGGVCLPYKLEGGTSPLWFAQWQCVRDDATWNMFVSLFNPVTESWGMNVDINATPPTASGGATRALIPFQWQFPPYLLNESLTANWGTMLVYRIGEWQTVTARFPNCLFPEE